MSRFNGGASGGAGSNNNIIGANEDMFLQAFDSTPKLNIATKKNLENEMARVISTISNPNADWDNRVQAMKHFRSLVNSGIADQDDFHTTKLKSLEIPFQSNICDLRSQVVRETCITIAFLACKLQHKFARMAEMLLPSLIKLIPNSAKIISTSALVALRFIVQSTPHSKLISIIRYQLSTSKSRDIHRALCEISERIVSIWQPNIIERQINDFQEVLRLGICDPDESARQYARRAFNLFAEHFREHADRLFNSLDPQRQRMLNNLNHGGGSTLSMNGFGGSPTSGGNNGLNDGPQHQYHQQQHHHLHQNHHAISTNHVPAAPRTISHLPQPTSSMHHSSSSNLVPRLKSSFTASSTNGTTASTTANHVQHTNSPSRIRTPTARSTSAIDVAAQKRARARAVYLTSMYTRPRGIATTGTPAVAQQQQQQQQSYQQHHQLPCSAEKRFGVPSATRPVTAPAASAGHQSIGGVDKPDGIPIAMVATPTTSDRPDGGALQKAASYLLSALSNKSISESQIVTAIKYFNSLIDKSNPDTVRKLLPDLMPPLVNGVDNGAICVRKATVFAMVSVYAKVGIEYMESYLTSLTMTQRKLLEVYIKKFEEENKNKQQLGSDGDTQQQQSRRLL